jgi:hypothetical protein
MTRGVNRNRNALVRRVAILIQAALFQPFNQLQLIRLILEELLGLLGGDLLAHESLILADKFLHARFDLGQVLRREGARQVKVIVKAILDGWPDGDFSARELLQHRLSHDMRRRVPDAVKL